MHFCCRGKAEGVEKSEKCRSSSYRRFCDAAKFYLILISFYASLEVRNSADSSKRLLEQQICDLEARITRQQVELDSLKEGAMQRESGTCTFKSLI